MAEEHTTQQTLLLSDVLSQRAIRERIALVNHLHDCLEQVRVVAEGVCGLDAPPPLTLQQVGDHLQAARHHLECATDLLGVSPTGAGAADAERG